MSRRKVGGAIKKPKTPKISLEEQEDEENLRKLGDIMKSKGSTKTKPISKKGGKFNTEQQKQILLEIENENTTKHIKELCQKFEPPACLRCQNRNANRICVCEACGYQDYFSLICGKCHTITHTVAKEKPELDIEEFFVNLGTFINETKADPNFSEQDIDVEKLQGAIAKIADFKNKLEGIKEVFSQEIATYKSPEEVESVLAGSVAKAMSEPTYANIQDQLAEIKGALSFENNEFKWNSIQDKATFFYDQVHIVKEESKELKKAINCSFIGDKSINLSKIEILKGACCKTDSKLESIISVNKDNGITLQTMFKSTSQQVCLDFEINPKKKYALNFTANKSLDNSFCVGLAKKDDALTTLIRFGGCGLLFKRFSHSSITQDCSKVLKGNMFGDTIRPGDSFEMRFCIEEQILEFSTLPGYQNVVSKLDHVNFDTSPEAKYVIFLYTLNNVLFSFNSLKEVFSFPSYY